MIRLMRHAWFGPLLGALVLASLFTTLLSSRAQADAQASECVITLHGMGRTKLSMSILAGRLAKAGFTSVNFGYPSTRHPIEYLAATYIPKAIESCPVDARTRIHFVTHSLGGILVRQYLQDNALPEGSRIVMLAPPNQGSDVAERLRESGPYEWATGPPGQQLGTGDESVPKKLAPVDYEVGVIAGEHDGKVSVDNARLEEMTDFLVVNAAHTFIMNDREVGRAAIRFLKTGSFAEPEADATP